MSDEGRECIARSKYASRSCVLEGVSSDYLEHLSQTRTAKQKSSWLAGVGRTVVCESAYRTCKKVVHSTYAKPIKPGQ